MSSARPAGATYISTDSQYLKFTIEQDIHYWSVYLTNGQWMNDCGMPANIRSLHDIDRIKLLESQLTERNDKIKVLVTKLSSFACGVLDFNECEQESEDMDEAFSICLASALAITGRGES